MAAKSNRKVLVLPGDGIGPEVMRQVYRVVEWFDRRRIASFEIAEDFVGGAAYEAHGTPLHEKTLRAALAADAVLFGAVGGPKWDTLPFALKPERGLLRLRKEMDLFANLRPALVFEPLIGASTLRPEVIRDLDLMIVRELTGGVYFGEPRGIETLFDGTRRGINTQIYTTPEIIRVGRVGFELARKRRGKLTSVEKANVMESGQLWRAEMQTGSLGMLPSASLGAADGSGRRKALYEPVHGSAPDIAGRDAANPLACVLSFAMMLRYSFDMKEEAELVERAVQNALKGGVRTSDILQQGTARVSTTVMGDTVLRELDKLA